MKVRQSLNWTGMSILLAMGTLTMPTLAAEVPELKFGSVAMDIPAEMHRRLKPLTKYLAEVLGRPVILQLSPDMPAAIKEVASGNVDFSYLTPVAYLKAKKSGNVQLIVKTVTQKTPSFQLMIVVKDGSPIKTVQDLAGKTFAFGDAAAILQRAVVVGAGMPLEKLGEHKFIGHYDNIAHGVLNGDFDAGVVKDTTAIKFKPQGLHVIYGSPPLPPYNIVASSKTDPKLVEQVRAAFLELDVSKPEHKAVLESLDPSYDGFVAVTDQEYDVIRELIKPFEK